MVKKQSPRLTMPPIYERNGKECYLDPAREKLIYVTPEETVRQWTISFLNKRLQVPMNRILVEEPLSAFGLDSRKRADILITEVKEDGLQYPMAVIECKAENVGLDTKTIEQAEDYSDQFACRYMMLTNRNDTLCYRYDERKDAYIPIEKLPSYSDMLEGKYVEEISEPVQRIPYEDLEKELKAERESPYYDRMSHDISRDTPINLALPLFNLDECLMDESVRMKPGDYGMFSLIKDCGVRLMTYGNSSGGKYNGLYRSFLIDVDGSTEFYSIGLSEYYTWKNYETGGPGGTSINVAHDDEKTSHHALQLVADTNVIVSGSTLKFYHSGRITVGASGAGRIDELRELVASECPELVSGSRFYLGSLTTDHQLDINEPQMIQFIVNMISYAIIRDEYRLIAKSQRGVN